MTPKQREFAHRYSASHRADVAAREAGYSPARARQTGSELLRNPEIHALILELDADKRVEAGVDAAWAIDELKWYHEEAKVGRVPASVGVRALEALVKVSGLFVDRSRVEHTGNVVYTLHLDADLHPDGLPRGIE